MAFVAAFLLLSSQMGLAQLKQMDPGDPAWPNAVCRALGEASGSDAKRIWEYYDASILAIYERERTEDSFRSDLWITDLYFLGEEKGTEFAASLVRPGADIPSRLKSLAASAGSDFDIRTDTIYLGPDCGSYDHGPEIKLRIAARLFPGECIKLLASETFEGRAILIESLYPGDYRKKPAPLPNNLRAVLVRLAKNPNVLVRGGAILRLAGESGVDIDRIILEALRDPYLDTRAKAIMCAGYRRQESAVPTAIRFLKSESRELKAIAAQALARIANREAKDALLSLIQGSPDGLDYLRAAEEANLTEALPFLRNALEKRKDQFIFAAILALDPEHRTQLVLTVLRKADKDLSWAAITGAEKYKITESLPILRQWVSTGSEFGSNAFEAIVQMDPSGRAETILDALKNPNAQIACSAISAVIRYDLLEARSTLLQLCGSSNEDIRRTARRACESLQIPPP